MTPAASNPILWLRNQWNFKHNPFPPTGIARLGGEDNKENGLLFRPEVQQEQVAEAVEKYVLGTSFSGLKFGYLWSLGGGVAGDQRGFGKSSLLQYLVQEINRDFGRSLILSTGLDETDADENLLCASLASFDMANAKSLAAVFFEATRYACKFRVADHPTLATQIHSRLVDRVGTDDAAALEVAVMSESDNIRGRTIGPPITEFVRVLCEGDPVQVGRYVEEVKAGARGRVSAANYLATFLLFVRAADIHHMLLGCDQLEDFAATTTTRQKRSLETERFRDYVLELQPMADMLTIVVTLHPRAEQAIGEMWKLADLPSFAPDRAENEAQVVVLTEIADPDRARALLRPYLTDARKQPVDADHEFAPFTDDAIEVLLDRSDGKPRDILRKAFSLIDKGASNNWEQIDGTRAATILDSLTAPDQELPTTPSGGAAPLEEQWT